MRFIVGDLLTGRRLQNLAALSGTWNETLNRAGSLSCTVTLRDPAVARLDLGNSATPGKAFLAAVEDDTVLAAGPVWAHDYEAEGQHLTLTASGMWSHFDHRVVLPDTDLNPTDPLTNTDFVSSLQGVVRGLIEQAMSRTSGDVPVILPDEIAGTTAWSEVGSNLAFVGQRISDITTLDGGPEVQFAPRWTSDRLGVEWVLKIGTPTQPMIYSPQDVVFNVGIAGSSVSNLTVKADGSKLATRAYASGGRASDSVLISVDSSDALLDNGFPVMEVVDSSHASVIDSTLLDSYAGAIISRGRAPIRGVSFDHQLSQRPYASAFTVGDFASVRIKDDPYLGTQTIRMRVTGRSGTLEGTKLHVDLQPETTDG